MLLQEQPSLCTCLHRSPSYLPYHRGSLEDFSLHLACHRRKRRGRTTRRRGPDHQTLAGRGPGLRTLDAAGAEDRGDATRGGGHQRRHSHLDRLPPRAGARVGNRRHHRPWGRVRGAGDRAGRRARRALAPVARYRRLRPQVPDDREARGRHSGDGHGYGRPIRHRGWPAGAATAPATGRALGTLATPTRLHRLLGRGNGREWRAHAGRLRRTARLRCADLRSAVRCDASNSGAASAGFPCVGAGRCRGRRYDGSVPRRPRCSWRCAPRSTSSVPGDMDSACDRKATPAIAGSRSSTIGCRPVALRFRGERRRVENRFSFTTTVMQSFRSGRWSAAGKLLLTSATEASHC